MATGLPVALCFILLNLAGAYIFFGGSAGAQILIRNMYSSLAAFSLLPLPLFILMGELMFSTGIGTRLVDIVDRWLGRMPGRLALIAVGAGTLLSTLTGASVSSVAILGDVLVPEMEKRGYKKALSLGPILGSGGLAMMIPPSALAILLGAVGQISIGKLLMAIIMPGLLMAALYAAYIIGRCTLQPSLAPPYEVPHTPFSQKLILTIRYVLPMGLVIFLVIGVILMGIATPSEAAASGSIGVFILAAIYGRLNWASVKKAVTGTITITGMIFLIICGAKSFSQILAFSGAISALSKLATSLPVAPILIVIGMMAVVVVMGCLMEPASIMMITLPVFMPVIEALNFDPVWFGTIFLLNIEMGLMSPPFGMSLFVMKGVAPLDTTMGDIYKAALPFLYLDVIAMALIIVFPSIALWLPSITR